MRMIRFQNSIGEDIYINPEFVLNAIQNGPEKVAICYSSHSNVLVKGKLKDIVLKLTGAKKTATKRK